LTWGLATDHGTVTWMVPHASTTNLALA